MQLIAKVDVLVIGAGIMGASCAFHLAEQGTSVVVLEAQNAPATVRRPAVRLEYAYNSPKKSTFVYPGKAFRPTSTSPTSMGRAPNIVLKAIYYLCHPNVGQHIWRALNFNSK